MRVGQGYITAGNKTVQISDNTSPLQEVSFLSIFNKSDYTSRVIIRLSTTDTATFPDGYKHLYEFKLEPSETRTFGLEDFPSGATGATHFGGSATTNKLDIYSEDTSPNLFIFYSVYDMSNPRSLTGVQTNFVGDSGSGGAQGLVPPPGAGDAAAGKYLDADGTWTTPPDVGEANVNADWNASSGDAQILNKPTIPAAYTDSDAVSAVATADDYLKNDTDDTMNGSLTLNQSLFLLDSGSGATGTKSKIINRVTTSNQTLDVPNASGTIQIDVSGGFPLYKGTAKITLSTADFNSLDTTPVQIVAAQGANTVIIPTGGIIRVDRALTQTNSSVNLDFHYNGVSPAYATTSLIHLRRFMYNETGDRVYALTTPAIEMGQNLTDDVNSALEVSASAALTNNCITSATIFLTYNIIDIS